MSPMELKNRFTKIITKALDEYDMTLTNYPCSKYIPSIDEEALRITNTICGNNTSLLFGKFIDWHSDIKYDLKEEDNGSFIIMYPKDKQIFAIPILVVKKEG